MMRVLHSVSTYLSLSENWIYPQIARVPNVESHVFCSYVTKPEAFPLSGSALIANTPSWERALGIPRMCNAVARRLGLGGVGAQMRVLAWRPQIVHAHFGTRGYESLFFKRRLRVPLVTSFYGYDAWLLPKAQPVWRRRYTELFTAGDLFIVEGPAMQRQLLGLGCPASKLRIHRIGVDLALLPFQTRDFSKGLKIAMVGRFVEKKGLIDGLRACILARSHGVNLSVTIIGNAGENDISGHQIKEELRVLARQPELSDRVNFTGFLPLEQTRATLAAHNVFLCPSKHSRDGDAEGGSPVALTEAMALGLHCIGTRHCDIPEVILDGKTGHLCDEGDVLAMADILRALGTDSRRFTGITKSGRKHIERNFSLSIQLEKIRSIYGFLLSNGH